jgi:hypothetical protein
VPIRASPSKRLEVRFIVGILSEQSEAMDGVVGVVGVVEEVVASGRPRAIHSGPDTVKGDPVTAGAGMGLREVFERG